MVERGVENLTGDAVGAADQLDDDVNLGIGRHRRGILVPAHRREVRAAIAPAIACRDRSDDDAAAGAVSQQVGLPVQQLEDAGANSAETGDGDLERRFHDGNPDAMGETREPLHGRLQATQLFVAPRRQIFDSVSQKRAWNHLSARARQTVRRGPCQCSSSTSARLSPEFTPCGAASTWILSEGIPSLVRAEATA